MKRRKECVIPPEKACKKRGNDPRKNGNMVSPVELLVGKCADGTKEMCIQIGDIHAIFS